MSCDHNILQEGVGRFLELLSETWVDTPHEQVRVTYRSAYEVTYGDRHLRDVALEVTDEEGRILVRRASEESFWDRPEGWFYGWLETSQWQYHDDGSHSRWGTEGITLRARPTDGRPWLGPPFEYHREGRVTESYHGECLGYLREVAQYPVCGPEGIGGCYSRGTFPGSP